MNTVLDELIMIVSDNGHLKASTGLDFPIEHDGIREVVDTQPSRETPIEWLPINDVDRSISVTWDQYVIVAHITVNESKAIAALAFGRSPLAGVALIAHCSHSRPSPALSDRSDRLAGWDFELE